MSEPKEIWEVARDASDLAMQCGKPYWSNIVDTVIAEHERRKADPYAIRDKPKKVDWSQTSPHVLKYWSPRILQHEVINFPSIWIPWGLPEFGDKCPVPEGVMVSCVLRRYQYDVPKLAEFFNWDTLNKGSDIIAFRITGIAEGWEP